MTKITLSTGDKFTINASSAEIMKQTEKDGWIMVEDNGRDIAIRSSHIIAVEEDTAAVIKAAINGNSCASCGRIFERGERYVFDVETQSRYCLRCNGKSNNRR